MSLKMVSVIVTSTDGRAEATDLKVVSVDVVAAAAVGVVDDITAFVVVRSVRYVAAAVVAARIVDGDVATLVSTVLDVADDVVPDEAAVVAAVPFDVDGPLS